MSYVIIWRYRVPPSKKQQFEQEYGAGGSWSKLFSASKDYQQSLLYQSEQQADTYFVIDTWNDRQSYEDFKAKNSVAYDQLSDKLEPLHASEERLGTFHSVEPAP